MFGCCAHSTGVTYADDITSFIRAKFLEELIEKLEYDAKCLLNFMASNGLVTNASKTALLILNKKGQTQETDRR